MGLDYIASAVYGFYLKPPIGEELPEWGYMLERDYPELSLFVAGNAYSGEYEYVLGIGIESDENNFGFEEYEPDYDEKNIELIKELAKKLGQDEPKFYVGLYVC